MATVFDEALIYLQQYTGIWKRVSVFEEYKLTAFIVIFVLALFVGFYLYRFAFSLVFFTVFSTFAAWGLSKVTSWNYTLAIVSVVGVVFSFLLFRADRLGANVISGLVAAGLVLSFGLGLIPAIIAAAIAVVITVYFPVHSVCAFTALFGGLGIMEVFNLNLPIGILIILVGIAVQYITTRKQTVTDKRLPKRLEYYLEKRKANEKCIPQGN